jgi:hypothetical protein
MSKIIGYVLMIAGVVVIGARFLLKNLIEKIPILNDIKITALVGIGLIIVGFFLTNPSSSSGKQEKEVPVYDKHGKKLVGYRRTK